MATVTLKEEIPPPVKKVILELSEEEAKILAATLNSLWGFHGEVRKTLDNLADKINHHIGFSNLKCEKNSLALVLVPELENSLRFKGDITF